MIISRISGIVFDVEKYINICDFKHFDNVFLMAAAVGLIEGNIQISKEDNLITLLDIYNIQYKKSDYIFLSTYNLIQNHNEIYKFIIKYFNLWHSGKLEEFTYDNYHKNNLKDNFNNCLSLIYDEFKSAIKENNFEVIEIYKGFIDDLAEEFK